MQNFAYSVTVLEQQLTRPQAKEHISEVLGSIAAWRCWKVLHQVNTSLGSCVQGYLGDLVSSQVAEAFASRLSGVLGISDCKVEVQAGTEAGTVDVNIVMRPTVQFIDVELQNRC